MLIRYPENNALISDCCSRVQINVNVTYAGPQYGRVVVAAEPVTRGDILAAIPVELCWNTATAGGNGSMQVN